LDNPTIDVRHQLVTLGGCQELSGADNIAVFIAHPQQHLDGGAMIHASSQGDDCLGMQLEPVFL